MKIACTIAEIFKRTLKAYMKGDQICTGNNNHQQVARNGISPFPMMENTIYM